MSDWTRYLHTTVAALTIAVALYYRVPQLKRKSFEEKFPRVAALIGMIAGIIPFLPMILDNAKRLVTPPHATPVVAHIDPEETVRTRVDASIMERPQRAYVCDCDRALSSVIHRHHHAAHALRSEHNRRVERARVHQRKRREAHRSDVRHVSIEDRERCECE